MLDDRRDVRIDSSVLSIGKTTDRVRVFSGNMDCFFPPVTDLLISYLRFLIVYVSIVGFV